MDDSNVLCHFLLVLMPELEREIEMDRIELINASIQKAAESEIDAVAQCYEALHLHEQKTIHHSNWAMGIYPTRKTAQAAFEAGSLYIFQQDGIVCASMILNQVQPDEYSKVAWRYPAAAEQVLVLHTLCVHPAQAGKGIGQAMVQYALLQASSLGYKAMRLDTYAGNVPASALYEKLGFRLAGTGKMTLAGVIEEDQLFFEKQV